MGLIKKIKHIEVKILFNKKGSKAKTKKNNNYFPRTVTVLLKSEHNIKLRNDERRR